MALYCAFVIVPVLMTFYNSVHKLEIYGSVTRYTWVGFQHYERLLPQPDGLGLFWADNTFKLAVQHAVTWAAVSPFLEIPLALVLAYVLHLGVPGVRFFRFAWFAPVLISWVVVGIIFKWIYNYEWGAVNVTLRALGLDALATNWLGNTSTALPALIAMTTWKQVGFNMVILLAAISSIPAELIDAARIDGAGRVRILLSLVVPLVRVTVVNLLVLCFMGKMEAFAAVWTTTQGGPVYATETVATYMQKRAFMWQTFDLGYPSAMAVIWCAIVFGLALFFQRVLQRRQIVEF
ncbi:MAG TPA: sugar ABC transporter permease [Chloroflexota bacterium]|jgi:multiple sugar transport system permease protein/raffinose/stachyose/melibiose transport system permease protein|nr:sugar ABC transporter permease [Chloroflexota bacterium]